MKYGYGAVGIVGEVVRVQPLKATDGGDADRRQVHLDGRSAVKGLGWAMEMREGALFLVHRVHLDVEHPATEPCPTNVLTVLVHRQNRLDGRVPVGAFD